jgi:proteasome lid subunit RPN8/RPN11
LLQLSHKRFGNRNFEVWAMLQMPESVYHQLRRHGEGVYPHECCGILTGVVSDPDKIVSNAIPVENASTGNTRNHYEINPIDLVRIERQARVDGIEILGFYHSHPDHPAQPSFTDLAEAHWLGCSYVITAVANGEAAETRSFHLAGLSEEDKHFQIEEVSLQASYQSPPS